MSIKKKKKRYTRNLTWKHKVYRDVNVTGEADYDYLRQVG